MKPALGFNFNFKINTPHTHTQQGDKAPKTEVVTRSEKELDDFNEEKEQ